MENGIRCARSTEDVICVSRLFTDAGEKGVELNGQLRLETALLRIPPYLKLITLPLYVAHFT